MSIVSRLRDYCDGKADAIAAAVEALARLESPSTEKAAVDRCGAYLTARLGALGATVQRVAQNERGDHIRATFGAGSRRVLLLGHFDTVWPVGQLARMPVRRDDARLYGPGVFDMKAGLAVTLLALEALAAADTARVPSVVVLWTTDEEIGSGTSRTIIEGEARQADAVLVLEPSLPGGAAKTSRKGCGEFELTVRGVSAHAGIDPGKGASAILELAHQIVTIAGMQDLARGISVNVGVVEGGSRTNVVAEFARARVDVRVPTLQDAAALEAQFRQLQPRLPGTRLELHGGIDRPPLERRDGVVRLFEIARRVAADLGQELGEGGTGGGSDGNFTAALGVPTLDGLGPRGDGAHALHEHVELIDLSWRAAFLAALLERLGR